ncbi:MAG: phosphohistidine phosphatase SixA [Bacteroidetes bacterium]|nr:phosphohistidine phosphatase SixA [Bacteroidota bacterium]
MLLYLLRHGQAGQSAPTDFERELTGEGLIESSNVGTFLAAKEVHFTHAFVSPLVRAQQTLRAVLAPLPNFPVATSEYLTPDSDPRNILELLRTIPADSRVLLVTHEPFVSACISMLISSSETAQITMKPATLACVETRGVPARGSGTLRWLLPPETIRPK